MLLKQQDSSVDQKLLNRLLEVDGKVFELVVNGLRQGRTYDDVHT